MTHSALARHVQGRNWPLAATLAADLRCCNPDDPAGYEVGACAARELGDLQQATALLAEAGARFPEAAWPLLEGAWTARMRGDLDLAVRLAAEARGRFPGVPAGYRYGAFYLMQHGRLEEAEAVFRAAMQRFPAAAWPWREAAAMARRRANRTAAAQLATALRAAPQAEAARGAGTVVVVLGMHRAGTSLCAHVVQQLGINLGGPLTPPNFANPDGYQEHAAVVAAHEWMLAEEASEWDMVRSVKPLSAGFWGGAVAAAARQRLQSLVAGQVSAHDGAWAFKDPRTMRFLPIWREVFAALRVRPIWLLAVRAPCAVAASLRRRDGLPPDVGELLWLEHYLDALRHLGPEIALVVPYERWFGDPLGQAHAIAAAIGRTGTAEMQRAVGAVRAELRHHRSDHGGPGLREAGALHAGLCADPPDLVALQREAAAIWQRLESTAGGVPAAASV